LDAYVLQRFLADFMVFGVASNLLKLDMEVFPCHPDHTGVVSATTISQGVPSNRPNSEIP
jgi:hypothetical protein